MKENLFSTDITIYQPDLNTTSMPIYAQQWDLEFLQMQEGDASIYLNAVHTPRIQLSNARYPKAMLVNGSFPKNAILLFYTKSEIEFTFNNKKIDKFELIVADKDTKINYLSKGSSEVFTICIEESYFYESFYNYFNQSLKIFLQTKFFQIKEDSLDAFLHGLLGFISKLQDSCSKDYVNIEKNILNHIFENIKVNKIKTKSNKFDVSLVRDILHNSLMSKLDILDISKELKVSKRQIFSSFKQAYGFTPKQYLYKLRLNAIKKELSKNPKSKIYDIALKYNFLHMSHFSAEFKKMFGLSPSNFVKSL